MSTEALPETPDTPNTMTHHGKGDLTKGDVGGHLVRLTIPMIWGILAMISFQLVDMYFISLMGTKYLTAITFTFPLTYAIFAFTMGMSIATSSVISRQIGARNTSRVRRLTTHALILSFIIGILLATGGHFIIDPLFRAMGANDEMMPIIRDFITIWFWSSVFNNMSVVGNAAIRASGDTVFPAMVMVLAAIANAILDPLLIFGYWGFPEMGVRGAATATLIANSFALAAGLYVIAVRKKMLVGRIKHAFRLLGDSAKRIFMIAIPAGLTTIMQPVTNAVIIALLADMGGSAVAAFGIASRVEAFMFVIIMALAVGMSAIIGQNWGAQKYDRVNETLKKTFTFALLWSAFTAVLLAVFAKPVAGLFTTDQDTIRMTALYFMIIAATYIPGNLVQGWGSACNAIGVPQRSFIMVFTRLILINIPLAMIGNHLFGVAGVFGAIAVTNLVTGIAFHIWNRNYFLRMEAPITQDKTAPARR